VNGAFTIKVKSGATLIVSEIGYENQQVVANATNLLIKLATDTKSLNEVVVTGVGVATSKKKIAVAVESVNISNQVKVPTADVGQQLVGQIAGAQITSKNGNPGQPLNILLRGINSVQGGTAPMILVDGVEVRGTDLQSIDVNIIDRVEVVQAAALEFLRRERRVALAFKGLSFYDARRYDIIDPTKSRTGCTLLAGTAGVLNTNATIVYGFLDYWDVPDNEIVYNPALTGSAPTKNPKQ
jgi:hypothetical protein